MIVCLPTEDSKNQVKHKEWTDDDKRDEVQPIEHVPHGVVSLQSKE